MTINPTNVRRFTPDVLKAAKIAMSIDEGATASERELINAIALLHDTVAAQCEIIQQYDDEAADQRWEQR